MSETGKNDHKLVTHRNTIRHEVVKNWNHGSILITNHLNYLESRIRTLEEQATEWMTKSAEEVGDGPEKH